MSPDNPAADHSLINNSPGTVTIRQEFLDHVLLSYAADLKRKRVAFRRHLNFKPAYTSHDGDTPCKLADNIQQS